MKDILIVEDELVIALDMKTTLEKHGHTVVGIVSTAEEAISLANELKPDIVLMDINLKGSKNGIEAAKEIFETNPDEKIIFVSAFENRWFSEPTIINSTTFFKKPINFQQLLDKINNA